MTRLSYWPGLLVIVVCGLVLAWPIVTGGWMTYLDNPAHIAEIHSLAFDGGNGWSDLAWLGYPLGRLHSPLWYGGFSALVRAGLALGPTYAVLVVFGFLVPPVVIFLLARQRTGTLFAMLLAWLLMVQKTSLVGYGSPLGGMWTFYISCGAYLGLLWLFARRENRVGDLFWIAGLYGLLGITHLFTIVPAVILFLVAFATKWRDGHRRFLLAQAVAAGVGALASASYWAPMVVDAREVGIIAYNLTPLELLARLFLGAPVRELVNPATGVLTGVSVWMALPMVALIVVGVGGYLEGRKTGHRAGAYGMAVAGVVLVLLFVLGFMTLAGKNSTLLGHVSWRMLFFVRLGLAVAAIPLLEKAAAGCKRPKVAAIVWPVLMLVFSLGLGAPLRGEVLKTDSAEMDEIHELWDWMDANRQPGWGRVYVQDPFGSENPMGYSHVMSLTRMETGVDMVGPLYAGSPFPTVSWLVGESRKLFGVPMRTADHFRRMLQLAPAANTTRLVLHWPELADEMVSKGYARYEYRSANWAVLAMVDYPESHWAASLSSDVAAWAERVSPDKWRVTVDAAKPDTAALLKVSWSPHWRVVGADGVKLDSHALSLIQLSRLPVGRSVFMVEFGRPRWPDFVTGFGWGLWTLLLLVWRLVPGFRRVLGGLVTHPN